MIIGYPYRMTIISIHAPRRGSDFTKESNITVREDFNPRSPQGERRDFLAMPSGDRNFNPRSPQGERPARCLVLPMPNEFQSTLPAGGAT